jgi:hypothetical protein
LVDSDSVTLGISVKIFNDSKVLLEDLESFVVLGLGQVVFVVVD